jgi:hypothetical protein
MTSKKLAAIAAVAALAVPTAAVAANEHANSHSGSHGQGSAKGHSKAKNTVFKGTVVSTDLTAGSESITIHVLKASHWGKSFKDTDVTFTVATVKKINVADTNGDGKRDLADFKANDPVMAQARITKDSAQPIAARKLNSLVSDGSDDDAAENDSQSS